MITILLADDHIVLRQGLRSLIESQPDFTVVGEANNGREALDLIHKLKPQVSILDMMMPGVNGLEVTRQVCQITHVLILSMHANEAYVLEALKKGAFGYILKEATAAELNQAIRQVAAGQRYLGSPFSERTIASYLERTSPGVADPYETLTSREREILQLVAEGFSSGEIALRLSISQRTVEAHRANINRKLNLHSHADLVKYAILKGILPMER